MPQESGVQKMTDWLVENWGWLAGVYAALATIVFVYRRKEAQIKTFVLATEWKGDDAAFGVLKTIMRYLSFALDVVGWFMPGAANQRTPNGAMLNQIMKDELANNSRPPR